MCDVWGLLGAELTKQSSSCRKERPVLSFIHCKSSTEGPAQCHYRVLHGVLHQKQWKFSNHPPLSHHLHWVKWASQDKTGLLNQFIKSLLVNDRAVPADHSIENHWYHSSCKSSALKVPELPQQVESPPTFLMKCSSVVSPVLFIVQVGSQVRCHNYISIPWMSTFSFPVLIRR